MRIAVRSGSLAGSASATRRARSQLIRAARISRLLDQAPARMCQAYAARRSPAASRCSAIRAAFSPTESGSRCFDGGGEPPVQLGAIRLELRLVGDRANQRMVEHILGLSGEPDLIDELGRHQVGNDRFDAQLGQQVEAEPRPDDRRRAQRAFRFRVEPIDARGDGRLQRGRHTHLSNLCGRHVCAALPAQHTTLGQFAHDLLGEKRITGGPLGDRLAQPANRGVRPEQLRNQCCRLRITQRRKGYGLCTVHPRQCAFDTRGGR